MKGSVSVQHFLNGLMLKVIFDLSLQGVDLCFKNVYRHLNDSNLLFKFLSITKEKGPSAVLKSNFLLVSNVFNNKEF